MDDSDSIRATGDAGVPPTGAPTIAEVIARRLSRRALLGGMAAAVGAAAMGRGGAALALGPASTTFAEIAHGLDERDHLPEGYRSQVLLRWGDRVAPDAPAFAVDRQSAAAQERQFGYNCDYVAFLPLPAAGGSSDHGLLFVNHEYTIAGLMFPGIGPGREAALAASAVQSAIEIAAHGGSVVEVRRGPDGWRTTAGRYNRRITGTTPTLVSGPAAGHPRMRTSADPTGRHVLGTLSNCAGGVTPWGTVLTCEENINGCFAAPRSAGGDAAMLRRYTIAERAWYAWPRHFDRFDVAREPHEPNRFGWVVEIDPYDPASVPVKRTALGRFKHECASCVVDGDGRVVVYQGDDQRFEYVYKFVTRDAWDPADAARNRDLLDHGTLHVARFHDDGRLEWLPLVHGQGPLTAANGLADQGEVAMFARRAADLVGATPMDRPEDVEPNPVTGRVYVMLTGNANRKASQRDAANPRADNRHGHVLEIVPPTRDGRPDHGAAEARWEIFLLAGRPGVDAGARYHPATSSEGWLSRPDNCAFDREGRIWMATDDAGATAGVADGLYVADTTGPGRALARLFYQAPIGAEVTGPCFTPDGTTLFLSVQHPGQWEGSSFEAPATRWPDFAPDMPPRPSVIAITRDGGGPIGS
ncbi:MAG: PhoX family phosphatase [Alphaproteobacteria bacterium]|nr:PhoX family phosphatase [Alphaproteobacteria bacterium]